jgi:hypothetical protein
MPEELSVDGRGRRTTTPLIAELCADLALLHVFEPLKTETVTPEQTYYRRHGTTGSRRVHADDELRRLRDRDLLLRRDTLLVGR